MLRVQHAPNHGFAHTQPLGKFGVGYAAFAHREIQGQLWRQIERNADEVLAALGLGGWRNLVIAGDASGNRFG